MTKEDEISNIAQRFFDAIEAGDIEAMQANFADEAEIWHNSDELIITPSQTAQILSGMLTRISNPKYTERQLMTFPGGFVQQHILKGMRVHDNNEVRLPCAIICRVKDGKIVRLDEYYDSAHIANFRKFANA